MEAQRYGAKGEGVTPIAYKVKTKKIGPCNLEIQLICFITSIIFIIFHEWLVLYKALGFYIQFKLTRHCDKGITSMSHSSQSVQQSLNASQSSD